MYLEIATTFCQLGNTDYDPLTIRVYLDLANAAFSDLARDSCPVHGTYGKVTTVQHDHFDNKYVYT